MIIYAKDPTKAPQKMTPFAAGYDIYADTKEPILIEPGEYKLIPTGLYSAGIEEEYLSVVPRSGLALNYGITVLNAPGTIDADYTGEIGVILINLSQTTFTVTDKMRIAQLIYHYHGHKQLKIVITDNPEAAAKLGRDKRGGFGHTGLNDGGIAIGDINNGGVPIG